MFQAPIGVMGEPVEHVWPKSYDEHPHEAIALADLEAAGRLRPRRGGLHRAVDRARRTLHKR